MTKKVSVNPRISDKALVTKTGKTMEEWFILLDGMKATTLSHAEIVQKLLKKYGAEMAWHMQMITNSYEVARGLRKKHEKADGYEISISKTIEVPLTTLYATVVDQKRFSQWLKATSCAFTKTTKNKSIRATWNDHTLLSIDFSDKGDQKSQIVVQHRKLKTAADAEKMKLFWKNALTTLKTMLEK